VTENFEKMKENWWDIVDANRDMDVIHEEVVSIAMAAVEKCQQGEPLKRLWEK